MSIDSYSSTTRRKQLQTGEWAETEGLFHELLPYGYRQTNPIEVLQAFRDTFRKYGKYKQLLQASHFREHVGLDLRRGKALEQIYWAGSWPVYTHRNNNPYSYANPFYVHETYPPVEEGRRDVMLENIYEIPYWTDRKTALAWGVHNTSVRDYRNRRSYEYGKAKTHNLEKFARTLKTINSWGWTYVELNKCFPYSAPTLRRQVSRHAQDYTPPSNPYK